MYLIERLLKGLIDHKGSRLGNYANSVTYEELRASIKPRQCSIGQALRPRERGARRIAFARQNSISYIRDLISVLDSGDVPFLIDPQLSDAELQSLHGSCGFDAVLCEKSSRPGLSWEQVDDGDVSIVCPPSIDARRELKPTTEICRLTSGSTRMPACIEFSGGAVAAAADGWRVAADLTAQDRILCFAGIYNGLAFNTSIVPGLLAGANITIPAGLPSAGNIVRHVTSIKPTVFVSFPAAYDQLAKAAGDRSLVSSVRLALSSAAKLKTETATVLRDRLNLSIADYYGVAEAGPLTFNSAPDVGSGQGYPLPGVEIRSDASNQALSVRSRSMGTAYLNYPGEFEAKLSTDGFYQTTDLGVFDLEGRLHLTGRLNGGVNLHGRKFSLAEVETVLLNHPDVSEAVVTISAEPGGRQFLGAVLVIKRPIEPYELRRFCSHHLAPFKIPEKLVIADHLPKGSTGKVQAREIERLLS